MKAYLELLSASAYEPQIQLRIKEATLVWIELNLAWLVAWQAKLGGNKVDFATLESDIAVWPQMLKNGPSLVR